jgi:GTPase SAR1 family protein
MTGIVLVGNKADLEAQREISSDEGQDMAANHDMRFIETSAKTRYGQVH